MAVLLASTVTAACVVATVSLVPPPGHHELDCKLRQLAKEFATQIRPNASIDVVSDALQLDVLCGSTKPAATSAGARTVTTNSGVAVLAAEVIAAAVLVAYVDPLRGDDTAGDGSAQSPFSTVARGLEVVRLRRSGAGKAALVLRGGTHFVSDTLVLSAADSYLSIVAAPGERVTLSGGIALGELTWAKGAQGVYSAQLPPQPGMQYTVFDTLYEPSGRRAIRARYPK
eukprot:COSAG02_NODE_13619_length_1371_cov_2.121069_2_plen_228_part_00